MVYTSENGSECRVVHMKICAVLSSIKICFMIRAVELYKIQKI